MKVNGINIHDIGYLKGVEPKLHSKITSEWIRWEKSLGRTPKSQEIIDFSKHIDTKYNKYWYN